jgi:hypothetical protein
MYLTMRIDAHRVVEGLSVVESLSLVSVYLTKKHTP